MLGVVKKEEDSMTQPLLSTVNGELELQYPQNDELVNELISSLPNHIQSNTPTAYVSNGLYGAQVASEHLSNGLISNAYYNGHAVGIANFDFIGDYGDELDTSVANDNRSFEITYINFPESVLKTQRRLGGKSQQRIRLEDSKVLLGIKLNGIAQVLNIKVFVARVYDASFQTASVVTEPVQLEVKAVEKNIGEYRLNIDLDSVYEINEKLVYGLAKNKPEELNKFYLKVMVTYVDHTYSVADTKCFQIVGRARENEKKESRRPEEELAEEQNRLPPAPRAGAKRQRTGTDESAESNESSMFGVGSPSGLSTSSGYSSGSTDGLLIKASKVAADYLDAKNARIGSLITAEPIKSPHGDIAYHFILKNPDLCPHFDEGELIGMFESKNGDCVLDKLTQENSLDAVLKGVISRSQYFEARVQPKGVRTETVCMFGIVPVKVKGPVHRRDIIYASPENPGVAISGSAMGRKPLFANDASAIGMSWQTISADSDELNLVECLVSVTMEIFQGMIEKRFGTLKKDLTSKINDVIKARRRSKIRRMICLSALTVFLLLLSILLWQIFMPGSALRRYICEKGSVPGHTATFRYRPLIDRYSYYNVYGAEFHFDDLKKKTKELRMPIVGYGIHYYYNIDRCAFGGTTKTSDTLLGDRKIGGPLVFAVDETCKIAFYYYGAEYKWCRYKSAVDLKCSPALHSDHKKSVNQTLPGYCS